MGYLKKNDSKEINVQGEVIKIKKTGFGETRKAISAATTVDEKGKPMVDTALVGILKSIYAIESWSLVDENGKALPISVQTFDNLLDEDFVGELMDEVMNAFPKEGLSETEKN